MPPDTLQTVLYETIAPWDDSVSGTIYNGVLMLAFIAAALAALALAVFAIGSTDWRLYAGAAGSFFIVAALNALPTR